MSRPIVALLGANGAGKTTTFKCVLGMTDFRGKVEVAGKSAAKSGKDVRKLVGYLPQTPGFADDVGKSVLQLEARDLDRNLVRTARKCHAVQQK